MLTRRMGEIHEGVVRVGKGVLSGLGVWLVRLMCAGRETWGVSPRQRSASGEYYYT